jgi:hypothetical protein
MDNRRAGAKSVYRAGSRGIAKSLMGFLLSVGMIGAAEMPSIHGLRGAPPQTKGKIRPPRADNPAPPRAI